MLEQQINTIATIANGEPIATADDPLAQRRVPELIQILAQAVLELAQQDRTLPTEWPIEAREGYTGQISAGMEFFIYAHDPHDGEDQVRVKVLDVGLGDVYFILYGGPLYRGVNKSNQGDTTWLTLGEFRDRVTKVLTTGFRPLGESLPQTIKRNLEEASTAARAILDSVSLRPPAEPRHGPMRPLPKAYDGSIAAGMHFSLDSNPSTIVRIEHVEDWTVYARVLSGTPHGIYPGGTIYMGMNEFRRRAEHLAAAPPEEKVQAEFAEVDEEETSNENAARADPHSRACVRAELERTIANGFKRSVGETVLLDEILDVLQADHLARYGYRYSWIERIKVCSE